MNTAELKLEICCKTDDWLNLSAEQKSGLIAAIDDLDSGNGIPNDEVMKRYKSTYLTY